ncbi:hypothetical protein GCM10010253_24350 [Streptomyces badius]|uniref:Uncharacterized protein n=1 Tax=Streptomyces badius TaxID=1941 RepID=A0ABQ2T4I3_STRBA|nr:hypothetical protein GCM10010253_24350 [Streptomyces badius]
MHPRPVWGRPGDSPGPNRRSGFVDGQQMTCQSRPRSTSPRGYHLIRSSSRIGIDGHTGCYEGPERRWRAGAVAVVAVPRGCTQIRPVIQTGATAVDGIFGTPAPPARQSRR